jgi:hypothetical protein
MTNAVDLAMARSQADSTQRLLENVCSQIEEGDTTTNVGIVIGLGAIAVCERLKALAVQLDHAEAVNDASR